MPIVRSLRMELKFHCQSLILYYSPHPLRYIVENHWQIGLGELLSRCELFWCSLCSPPSSSLSATCALWITRHPNADDGAFLHHDKLDGAFSARAFQRWRHSSWNALLSFIANASSATFLLRNLYSHSSEQQKPVRRLYSNTIQVLIHCDDGLLLFIYIKKKKSRTYLEHQTSRLSSSTYVRPNPASGWSGSGSCPRRGLCGVVSGLQETRITSTASDLVENTLNKSIRPRTRWLTRFRFF